MARGGGGSAVARRVYLSLYNWVAFYGWAQVLYGAASALMLSTPPSSGRCCSRRLPPSWSKGFVRSPVSVTLSQISGRLYVTWGILWSFPEIIRYSFFGMKETFGFAPSWLLWLRYSTFLVLYPIGLLSEVGLIFVAMPSMKTSGRYYLRMPTKWNFTFDYRYMSALLTALYVPGFPYLFRYMVVKRKKVLPAAKTA